MISDRVTLVIAAALVAWAVIGFWRMLRRAKRENAESRLRYAYEQELYQERERERLRRAAEEETR